MKKAEPQKEQLGFFFFYQSEREGQKVHMKIFTICFVNGFFV